MNHNAFTQRAHWSSLTSYLFVTTGAIVGLGNIFQFPYYVSKWGGLFVLLYVLCELFVSLPILFAELLIGRRGKQNPVGAISILAMETGASSAWRYVGWLCFIILCLGLTAYTVAVAFPVTYFVDVFHLFVTHHFDNSLTQFSLFSDANTTHNLFKVGLCFLVFLFATFLVILRGINRGLETISWLTVPTYSVILIGLAIYACTQGYFAESLQALITIKPEYSFYSVLFAALTYAFFKLNVGMGSMIVYGSYLPYSVSLGRSTALIICFDALISLLSYFIIYPLALQSQHLISASEHYITNALLIFANIPHGDEIATFFFFAAILAAWTPTIAMAESATVTLIERFNMPRYFAALIVCGGAILIGTLILFSYPQWGHLISLHQWTLGDIVKNLSSKILLPVSAFFIAIFAGWVINQKITSAELGFNRPLYKLWMLLIRFLAPIAIVGICLGLLNIL